MWVARDKDNSLWLFTKEKPAREEEQGVWYISEYIIDTSARLNESLFPEITWENEPLEVSIISNNIRDNFTDFRYLNSTDEPNIIREFVRYTEVLNLINK